MQNRLSKPLCRFRIAARSAILSALLLPIALLAPLAHAAKFANQFVEFELPPQWQCNLEGAEWVCQSLDATKKRDAIIVLAAKLKGDQDSLDKYRAYLNAPKIYTSVQGKPVKSESKYAKDNKIGDQVWIDSLHLESEIPGFYTRYLATVKDDIAILVTYSINKDKYQAYLPQFEAMVNTLKAFRKAGPINSDGKANNGPLPSLNTESVFGPNSNIAGGNSEQPKKSQGSGFPIEYIGAGIVLVAFIVWRRKKAQGG